MTVPAPYSTIIPEEKNLFHYTDVNGLLGMVKDKKLWMTNIHYQNDTQEYYYAFKIIKKTIAEVYPGLLGEKEFDSLIPKNISGVFTFSLSEKKDLLSQWRGYCPDGGYSIGFERDYLNKVIEKGQLLVGRCMYDYNDQRDFVIKYIVKIDFTDYAASISNPLPGQSITDKYAREIHNLKSLKRQTFNGLNAAAALFKHPKFAEEKEWRLVKIYVGYSSDTPLSKMVIEANISFNSSAIIKVRSRKNML